MVFVNINTDWKKSLFMKNIGRDDRTAMYATNKYQMPK